MSKRKRTRIKYKCNNAKSTTLKNERMKEQKMQTDGNITRGEARRDENLKEKLQNDTMLSRVAVKAGPAIAVAVR